MRILLGFLASTILTMFSCGTRDQAPETPVVTRTTANTNSTSNTSSRPNTSSTASPIGPIPDSLTKETYKDSSGQTVAYDHRVQLQQLLDLKKQGKEIYLIIGRGNAEIKQPLFTDGDKRVWVFGQYDKDALLKDNQPHLFMNFDSEEHLKTIPDDLFAGVTFDFSVTKFFGNLPESVRHYYRMLEPGGKFFADLMLNGFTLGQEQRHLELACRGKTAYYTAARKIQYCLGAWDEGLFYDGRKGIATDAEEKEMEDQRKLNIAQYLESVFGPGKCELKLSGYPVVENDTEYLECTK
jgi:hypothetical protein